MAIFDPTIFDTQIFDTPRYDFGSGPDPRFFLVPSAKQVKRKRVIELVKQYLEMKLNAGA